MKRKKKKCKCSTFLFTVEAMAERPRKEGGLCTTGERGWALHDQGKRVGFSRPGKGGRLCSPVKQEYNFAFRSTFLKEVDERIVVSMGSTNGEGDTSFYRNTIPP
jgi:hypothetical protein